LHRGANSLLQLVLGGDATAEGSLSTTLAQTSSRVENYLNAGLPSAGNAGRLLYVTDLGEYKFDNGTTVEKLIPLTTKGDLLTRTTTGLTRVPVGIDGSFLRANASQASGIEWAATAGSLVIVNKTANYTLTLADDVVTLDASAGSFTITLPSAASVSGKNFVLKRTDSVISSVVTVTGTIDGISTWKLHTPGQSLEFYSNGTVFKIRNHRTHTNDLLPSTLTPSSINSIVIKNSIQAWTWTTVADVSGSLQNKYVTFETVSSGSVFTKRYVWINVASLGTDPALPGRTAHMASIATNDTATAVANAVQAAINSIVDLNSSDLANVVTCTSDNHGIIEDPTSGNSGFTTTKTGDGVLPVLVSGESYLRWKREGRYAVINFRYSNTFVGTGGSIGSFQLLELPNGLTADISEGVSVTSSFTTPTTTNQYMIALESNLGGITLASENFHAYAYLFDSRRVSIFVERIANTAAVRIIGTTGGSGNITFPYTTGFHISGTFKVPILDWKD
jgi:hypothetical protein